MKNRQKIKGILYAMTIIFLFIIGFFLVPEEFPLKRKMFILVAILGLAFMTLGIILTFLSRKEKGTRKAFLQLTGLSAIAPFAGTILHNFFYAISVVFEKYSIIFEILHATFFMIALAVAPITFIIGAIGSMLYLRKK